ncbi:MAG: DNA ligase, partial [Nitrososphaerota archaeon]|nr:DNA ligase [Nitrososphaerota archaeon]
MPYSEMVECYRIMESTTKRGELTDALVSLFRKTPIDIIDKVIYLNQGKLYPDYMGIEVGVGEKLAIRAISQASGIDSKKVEELYRRLGDLGSAAEEVLRERVQTSLFSKQLTVVQVYDTLDKIARTSGEGSL